MLTSIPFCDKVRNIQIQRKEYIGMKTYTQNLYEYRGKIGTIEKLAEHFDTTKTYIYNHSKLAHVPVYEPETTIYAVIRNRIREELATQEITPSALSEAIGMGKQTVTQILNRKQEGFRVETVLQIARGLGYEDEELFQLFLTKQTQRDFGFDWLDADLEQKILK